MTCTICRFTQSVAFSVDVLTPRSTVHIAQVFCRGTAYTTCEISGSRSVLSSLTSEYTDDPLCVFLREAHFIFVAWPQRTLTFCSQALSIWVCHALRTLKRVHNPFLSLGCMDENPNLICVLTACRVFCCLKEDPAFWCWCKMFFLRLHMALVILEWFCNSFFSKIWVSKLLFFAIHVFLRFLKKSYFLCKKYEFASLKSKTHIFAKNMRFKKYEFLLIFFQKRNRELYVKLICSARMLARYLLDIVT